MTIRLWRLVGSEDSGTTASCSAVSIQRQREKRSGNDFQDKAEQNHSTRGTVGPSSINLCAGRS